MELTTRKNPLLDKIQMPGETFALPSGGLFYAEGVLDPSVKDAEVHVHPMTAIDEIILKTPDLLFSGEAIKQVFGRCVPQIMNTGALLSKDVDFLLVCLRKVSYGNTMTVTYVHNCENAKRHSYQIDITQFIKQAKKLDPTTINQHFEISLDNAQKVMLQPMRYGDFVKIMQSDAIAASNEESPEKARDAMISSLLNIISKVDDIEDKELIGEWLSQVPPRYIKQIGDKIQDTVDWGPDFTAPVVCQDCGEQLSIDIPLNTMNFFT